ncbi:MAG TPA: pyridoxamine 5'-phosphate oxidase family protein [Hyphomicrobiaceae bacterium]|nr:pyridoxamine 5'-phosphate oxidase family protein [Hyphomicrobiaceae bacterium]
MGQQFPRIDDKHRAFIESQRIFFVASAAPKGRVNVSPKGMATLRVLNPNEVAYIDCTGSGSETRAHLIASEDKRLTIMFCAFDGPPVILRLYGQGTSLMRGTPEYAAMLQHFEEIAGARQIIHLSVDLVQTSCGMGVPLFDYREDRQNLVRHWIRQGMANLRTYWGRKNMRSIDGLPTHFEPDIMLPAGQSAAGSEAEAASKA